MKQKFLFLIAFVMINVAVIAQHDISNSFFDQCTYRGAFDETTDWTSGWTNWDPQNTSYAVPNITKSGEITSNETWTSSNVYEIEGFLYVRDGVTLTIEPGTIIRGDKNTKGTLIIERGAKINAIGTSVNPVIFTSNEAAGSRDYGDWGGIIICGKASINVPGGEAQIEGGPSSYYGGSSTPDDADNSGVFQFIRIEFPGVPFVPDKEINGLTLAAVGNGTTIDHIQVIRSGDDAYEWFGGTVNAKYLVAAFTWDDDFDTDYGYRGMLQYIVSLRDSSIADPGSGSNGFESDNDGAGSSNTPITQPIFSNVSMFGPKVELSTNINSSYKRAMHLRRNSQINIYNAIFAGYKDGLLVDGANTQNNLLAGEMKLYGITMAGISGDFFLNDTLNIVRSWYNVDYRNNDTLLSNAELMITDPFNYTAPDFRPLASSPVLSGAIFSGIDTENLEIINNISVFPNPATNNISIEFYLITKTYLSIELIDIMGRLVMQIENREFEQGVHSININIQNLDNAVYFLRFNSNIFTRTTRIIKR